MHLSPVTSTTTRMGGEAAGFLRLGPVLLVRPLARGGSGEVWLGRHERLGVSCAVKMISASRLGSGRAEKFFRNEMRAAAALSHPGIVTVYDYGVVGGAARDASAGLFGARDFYLVLEYVDGPSLANRAVVEWSFFRRILLELLDVLSFAHARSVIHRDLKPANVLLPRRAAVAVKLADFGLSRGALAGSGDAFSRGGTPLYMAPEQILGERRRQGPWTDLYALGVLAFQVAVGRPPFGGGTRCDLFQQHLSSAVPELESSISVPAGFELWVRRLMAKDPRSRFQFAADARAALESLGPAIEVERELTYYPAKGERSLAEMGTTLSGDWCEEVLVQGRGVEAERFDFEPVSFPMTWRRGEQLCEPRVPFSSLRLAKSVPLYGREEERDELWRALLMCSRERRPRVVVLRGSKGVGKRRLAQWLTERAHELGIARFRRLVFGDQGGTGVRVYGSAAFDESGMWRRVDSGFSEDVQLLLHCEREGGCLGSFLASLSGRDLRRPLILLLDRVKRAPQLLEVLSSFLESRPKLRLLILLAVSNRELDDRVLSRYVARLERSARHHHLSLGLLDEVSHRRYLEARVGDTRIVDALMQRTAGNPLLSEHYLKQWWRERRIVASLGLFSLSRADDTVPAEVMVYWQPMLSAFEAGFSCRVRRAVRIGLAYAALHDGPFKESEVLRCCVRFGLRLPLEFWSFAQRQRLLVSSGDGVWRFSQPSLRLVILAISSRGGDWRALNRTLCEHSSPPEFYEFERAVWWLERLQEGKEHREVYRFGVRLGRALLAYGEHGRASYVLQIVGRSVVALCPVARRERLELGLLVAQHALEQGDLESGSSLLDELEIDLEGVLPFLRSWAWHLRARHFACRDDSASARVVLERALEASEGIDLEGQAALSLERAQILWELGSSEEAMAALELSGELSWELRIRIELLRVRLHRERGERVELFRSAELSLEMAAECGDRAWLLHCMLEIGRSHWAFDEREEARSHYETSLQLARALGAKIEVEIEAELGELLLELSAYTEAEPYLFAATQSWSQADTLRLAELQAGYWRCVSERLGWLELEEALNTSVGVSAVFWKASSVNQLTEVVRNALRDERHTIAQRIRALLPEALA